MAAKRQARFSASDKLISICFLLSVFHIALGVVLGLLVSMWIMGILVIVGMFLLAMAIATAFFRVQQSVPKTKINDDLPQKSAQAANDDPTFWALLFCLFLEN